MFENLDPILHSQVRLAVVSLLVKHAKLDFNTLKSETKATSGNLSVQLKKLEKEGYIKISKTFKNNYPLTKAEITKKGLNAFENYVKNLKGYIQP